jgi:hypothetical protein
MITTKFRYPGSLLGLAVGDALGTTVEFMLPGTFPPLTDIVGCGQRFLIVSKKMDIMAKHTSGWNLVVDKILLFSHRR